MPEKDIKTGFEQLDEDLEQLFDICEGENVKKIQEAIVDLSLPEKEFLEIVPSNLARLSSVLLDEESYKDLLDSLPQQAVSTVEEAKSLIQKYFSNIPKHPVVKLGRERAKWLEETSESLLNDKVNTISTITWFPIWVKGKNQKLVPAARIGFKNERGKVLLDSTADWEDLYKLVKMLLRVIVRLLRDSKPLADVEKLDLIQVDSIGKLIKETEKLLDDSLKTCD